MFSALLIGILLFTFTHWTQGDQVRRTDVCNNSGKFLKCESNHVLKIKDVICMPNNYTCPEKDRVVSICEGQRSCESIGLKQQLWTYCQDKPSRTVLVDFTCESVKDTPLCRTNLCSEESKGLLCPPGSSIHVTNLKCGTMNQRCPWNLHHVIFPTCEGKQHCPASGLRMLGFERTCKEPFVIADYICIQSSVIHGTCTGYSQTLPARFGIIKSPGFPQNPDGNPNGCVWKMSLGLGKRIDITVHLAYSREETEGSTCSAKFLHVQYVDCRTMTSVTEYFCQTHEVNISRQSCGDVKVQSYSYFKGDDRGNRFLVSYEVVGYDPKGPSYVPYTLPCGVTTGSGFYASSKDVKDGGYLTSDDSPQGNGTVVEFSFNPRRFSLILKIVMINFLLFVVAFILVMTICIVCYKTRQIDRKGNYEVAKESKDNNKPGTSSKDVREDTKVLLGDNNESTVSNKASNHFSAVQNSNTYDGTYNEIKPEELREAAKVHQRKKNPYASYDSLDFEDGVSAEMVGGRRYSARCSAEIVVASTSPTSHTTTEQNSNQTSQPDNHIIVGENGVPHVKINNDFYAIVQKPNSLRNSKSSPHPRNSFEMVTHSNHVNGSNGGPFSSSGALPQHDCMLHEIHCGVPPFPNPESYDNMRLENTQSSSLA